MQKVIDLYSGRYRPRQQRFANKLNELCINSNINYVRKNFAFFQRAKVNLNLKFTGIRTCDLNSHYYNFGIFHQILNKGSLPYALEIDLPHGLNSYYPNLYLSAHKKTKSLLEKSNLKTIITFSDWASRSFRLHYGETVYKKCIKVYPLTKDVKNFKEAEDRKYDFLFVSKNLVIKGGIQLINAFEKVKKKFPSAKLCMITNLKEASNILGNLDKYQGIKWINSNLDSNQICDYMENSRVLVHPSLSDSFGVVVVEAMACGCAILLTDFASFPEMVNNNASIIKAPFKCVVGDSYIQQLGVKGIQNKILKTLNFKEFQKEIEDELINFLIERSLLKKKMENSRIIYREKFSEICWINNMKKVLERF